MDYSESRWTEARSVPHAVSKTEMLRPFFEISDSKAHIIIGLRSPSSAFQWSKNAWPWMTSKRDSRCVVLALAPDASASTTLPCLTYINVPLLSYCEIRYVSKFTAALRGSPCDSTAFLFRSLPRKKRMKIDAHNLRRKIRRKCRTRSSATAEKQRVSCARLPRLATDRAMHRSRIQYRVV